MILLAILTYIFAILFVTQLRDNENVTDEISDFTTVHGTMWILLLEGILLDGPKDSLDVLVLYSYMLTGCFVLFIGISNFTLVNMLIGIICNVVDEVSKKSKEDAEITSLKNSLIEFLEVHDEDDDRSIKIEEFDLLMKNPIIRVILQAFGVDVSDLNSMKNNIFESPEAVEWNNVDNLNFEGDPDQVVQATATAGSTAQRLTFSKFLRTVLRLRGGNSAKVTDVVDLRDFIKQKLETHRDYMDSRLNFLETELHAFSGGATAVSKESQATLHKRSSGSNKSSQGAVCTLALNGSHAEVSPLRHEALGGDEHLVSRQNELEQRQLALEKELSRSREQLGQQLSDVQKQLNQLCSLFGDGRYPSIGFGLPHQVPREHTSNHNGAGSDDEDV